MRGARFRLSDRDGRVRIIPAYAGSTTLRTAENLCGTDHPRVCGEHPSLRDTGQLAMGSSPRMRGAHKIGADGLDLDRIIPAYAGSTTPRTRSQPWSRDHPRVCGEHMTLTPRRTAAAGSSPRMRGAHARRCKAAGHLGIIPAYAGEHILRHP